MTGAPVPAAGTTCTVDVLGTAVAISAPTSLRGELRAVLVDLEPATAAHRELALAAGDHGLELRDDGRIVRQGVDPAVAVATVIWHLNTIAAGSSAHVLLHAACVARPGGGAVLLVGGPGAGKSTLAAACLGAGFAYLSDELAAIDGTGRVVPYAKPLVLDGERLVPASALGRVAPEPVAPTGLVFPRYEPGAPLTEVPLEPGWALLTLAAHATNLGTLGATAFARLAAVALACPAVQLTHGDAPAAVAAVRRAAHRLPAPVTPAAVLPRIAPDTTTVAVADSLAVLHEPSGKVHVLNPAAAALWCGAAGADTSGRDPSHLVDAVLDTLDTGEGEPPARSTVAATVDRLVRFGLIPAPESTSSL
jgi:hypothetical protein